MEPLVSVIIPVFNSGKYVSETLQSVTDQTYQNIEVVIVDNGSTDELTIKLLQEFKTQYKLILSEQVDVSTIRNKAIDAATGTFILPLDSDDLIESTFIEKCVKAFQENPSIKLVRTYVELFGERKGEMPLAEYSYSLLLARNLMVVTSMFRRNDWEAIGGFDPKYAAAFEDWEFWINLLKEDGKVHTIKEPLFKYRIRRNSRNHTTKLEVFIEAREKIWEKHKEQFAIHYVNPLETFEYQFIANSKANKLGSILLSPFSRFKLIK